MTARHGNNLAEKLRKCWDFEFNWDLLPENVSKVRIISDCFRCRKEGQKRFLARIRSARSFMISATQACLLKTEIC